MDNNIDKTTNRLLLTLNDVAKLCGTNRETIQNMIKMGLKVYVCPVARQQGKIKERIFIDDLKDFIRRNTFVWTSQRGDININDDYVVLNNRKSI